MAQKPLSFSILLLLGILLTSLPVHAMFCTLFIEEEAEQDQEFAVAPGLFNLEELPDELLMLVSSNFIDIKNFDAQWFFEKKQQLDDLLNFAQTNKSIRFKILKHALPELIYAQDQAHALFSSNLEYPFKQTLMTMEPDKLLKIFVEVFGYNTYGVGTRIGMFLVSLIMPHDT